MRASSDLLPLATHTLPSMHPNLLGLSKGSQCLEMVNIAEVKTQKLTYKQAPSRRNVVRSDPSERA